MNSDYLIVSKKILPDYYEKVLEARRLLDSGAAEDVSSAVRQAGISRSTYYKYKDAIYTPESADTGRKAVISMLLSHQIGVLSNVLNRLSALGVNVLTISQSMPIHGTANVVMTLDIAQLSCSLENAIAALGAMRGVENAMLVSIE